MQPTCLTNHRFRYSDGCILCMCAEDGEMYCKSDKECYFEEEGDKAACDKVRRQTSEISQERKPCINSVSICPKYPSATFRKFCKHCKCVGGTRRARCRNAICPRIAKTYMYIHMLDEEYKKMCEREVARFGERYTGGNM